jgi:hypothetical protein
MLQTVTITNDSDQPIIVVPFDETASGQREDVNTHVLPGRAARLVIHELRYLAVYAQPGARVEPAPDLRIEGDALELDEAAVDG